MRTIVGITDRPFSVDLYCPCGVTTYGLKVPFNTMHCANCNTGDEIFKCWICDGPKTHSHEPLKHGLCSSCISDIEQGTGKAMSIVRSVYWQFMKRMIPRASLEFVVSMRRHIEDYRREQAEEYEKREADKVARAQEKRAHKANSIGPWCLTITDTGESWELCRRSEPLCRQPCNALALTA